MKKILIIKHGALGDIVFSLSAINSIKQHYQNYKIELLTEQKYISFFKKSLFFNKIIKDNRKDNLIKTISNLFYLKKQKYNFIIDLQNSKRTQFYNFFFRFFTKSIICSSRQFCHLRYNIPKQGTESVSEGLLNQLKLLNIKEYKDINFHWLHCKIMEDYKSPLVLFIPGVSKNNYQKQWSPQNFASLALYCEQRKYQICVIGANEDLDSCFPILNSCRNVINRIDSSPPEVIYSIALKSTLIITNDTGPGHIASLSKNNILWIANDNNITKSNISKNANNFLISAKNIKNITKKEVVQFIEKNNLL